MIFTSNKTAPLCFEFLHVMAIPNNIAYIFNLLFVSLDFTVTNEILQEVTKILPKKILKVTMHKRKTMHHHNVVWEKNNSPNGYLMDLE